MKKLNRTFSEFMIILFCCYYSDVIKLIVAGKVHKKNADFYMLGARNWRDFWNYKRIIRKKIRCQFAGMDDVAVHAFNVTGL